VSVYYVCNITLQHSTHTHTHSPPQGYLYQMSSKVSINAKLALSQQLPNVIAVPVNLSTSSRASTTAITAAGDNTTGPLMKLPSVVNIRSSTTSGSAGRLEVRRGLIMRIGLTDMCLHSVFIVFIILR
jgi:hypothetical protein